MTREEREFAKSRIEYLLKISRLDEHDNEALKLAIKALSQEPKTGQWEFHCQHWSKCSICGYADKFANKWNYCPNCGVKMENVVKSLIDIKAERNYNQVE